MADKTRKILQPQYFNKFKCIGSACEDSCCIGWCLPIDKDTYQRYRKCSDPDLRTKMTEKVTRNRSGAGIDNSVNYAKIGLNENGWCSFLDEEKLCAIQRKIGEEYLSNVCACYPRTANVVNGVTEKYLTVSCPEAARICLLDPEVMEFDELYEDVSVHNIIDKVLDVNDIKFFNTPAKYFWDFRIFTISLLQNREYPLWQRIIILGIFYQKVDRLLSEAKLNEIPSVIAGYTQMVQEGVFKDELAGIPNEYAIQMEIVKELADQRFFTGGMGERLFECYSEFLRGVQYTDEASITEISQYYLKAYEKFYKPFMDKHEYILENYLVNYVFKNLFPFGGEKRLFDNYVILVIHYAMIKVLLIGMAGHHKENLTVDHVVKLIQSFAKAVEHNYSFVLGVFKLLKANNFNSMAHMAILIKN